MKILTDREYNKLIDELKDYQKELKHSLNIRDVLCKQKTKLEVENYKLKNIIKSYKGVEYKNTNRMRIKLYELINKKLNLIDTSADELDKLFKIYYGLEGTLEDE